MLELIGFDSLLDLGDLLKLVVRFCIDLGFIALVVRGVYLRFHPRVDFAFSCVLLNVMTFAVCMLLRKVPVELGFALGLFGVFGILRYRTDAIGTRDLTYLFVSVGLGMLNAIANKKVSLAEVLFINVAKGGERADARQFCLARIPRPTRSRHQGGGFCILIAALSARACVGSRWVACCGLVLAFSADARAADDVLGALELGIRHELVDHLRVAASAQVRADDSGVQSWLPEAQVLYEPWKHSTLGTGYRLIYQRNAQGYFEVAHRIHVQAGLAFKIAPLHTKLKYRLRLQDRIERTVGEPTEHQPRLRNALELSYSAWSFATPFISGEHYLALDRLSDEPTRRWRFMFGVEHDIELAELEIYYRLDLTVNDSDPNRNMIGAGIQWEL